MTYPKTFEDLESVVDKEAEIANIRELLDKGDSQQSNENELVRYSKLSTSIPCLVAASQANIVAVFRRNFHCRDPELRLLFGYDP